jgi:hypothetical protein
LQLYLDGSKVNAPPEALLQAAIANYGRSIASPRPPIDLSTTVVNPPRITNAGVGLRTIYASLALLLSLVVGTTFVPQLLIEEKDMKEAG